MSIRSLRSTTQIPMIFNILVNITNIKMDINTNLKIQIITSRKKEGLTTRHQLISVILMQQLNITGKIPLFSQVKQAKSMFISNTTKKNKTLTKKKLKNLLTRLQLISVILMQRQIIIEKIPLFNHWKKATSTYMSNTKEQAPTLMTKLRIKTTMSRTTQLAYLCLPILVLECFCTWLLRCIFNSLLALWVSSLMTRKR